MIIEPAARKPEQAIAFAATTAGISGDLVRDVMVETMSRRFGDVPGLPSPAEWLTDNGSGYIARETRGTRHRS